MEAIQIKGPACKYACDILWSFNINTCIIAERGHVQAQQELLIKTSRCLLGKSCLLVNVWLLASVIDSKGVKKGSIHTSQVSRLRHESHALELNLTLSCPVVCTSHPCNQEEKSWVQPCWTLFHTGLSFPLIQTVHIKNLSDIFCLSYKVTPFHTEYRYRKNVLERSI